jgi:hypothetical protein
MTRSKTDAAHTSQAIFCIHNDEPILVTEILQSAFSHQVTVIIKPETKLTKRFRFAANALQIHIVES